ncbi:unnamed protein product, partial [Closterium sp. NIES-53]
LSSLDMQTRLGLTTWLRISRHRVTPSALAPTLFLGGLPARLLFSVPVVRERSTQVPWLHRS